MQQEHLGLRDRQIAIVLVFGLLILLRLALSSRLPSYILAGTPHDDGWVVGRALSIFKGEWLGPYDQYTLIKGAFSPLLMAFSAFVGVTFSGLNTALYCFACAVFVVSVRPLVKNSWFQAIIFALLLFNPLSYAMDTGQRIYRNGIGQWEILLIFGGLIAIFLRRNASWKVLPKWLIVSGLALGALMQTREDGTWIYPFVLGVIFFTILFFLLEKSGPRIKSIIFLAPVLIAVLLNAGIAFVNYKTYGAPVLNDRNGGNFAKVAGDLYAIAPNADEDALYKSDAYKDHYYNIYVSTMEKAFSASPTLNGASKHIRAAIRGWAGWEDVKIGQLSTDHMLFALRDGVRGAGYYKSLPETEKFYGKVHEELQAAFASGVLVKTGFPVSPLMKRLQPGDIGRALFLMPKAIADVVTFAGVSSVDFPPAGAPDGVKEFVFMAGGEYNADQIRLIGNGWAFAKNDKIRLSVGLYNKGGALIENLAFQSGEDVFNSMRSGGVEYQNAKAPRFSFEIKGYNLASGVTLRFVDQGGRLFKEIPLDGSVSHGQDNSFRYHFENLSGVGHNNIYDRLVRRANDVINLYQKFVPVVCGLACFFYFAATLLLTLEVRRKRVLSTLPVWLILTGITLSFLLFLFGMCLITATSFRALYYLYTAPAYLLLLMFCGVSLFWGAETVSAFRKRSSL